MPRKDDINDLINNLTELKTANPEMLQEVATELERRGDQPTVMRITDGLNYVFYLFYKSYDKSWAALLNTQTIQLIEITKQVDPISAGHYEEAKKLIDAKDDVSLAGWFATIPEDRIDPDQTLYELCEPQLILYLLRRLPEPRGKHDEIEKFLFELIRTYVVNPAQFNWRHRKLRVNLLLIDLLESFPAVYQMVLFQLLHTLTIYKIDLGTFAEECHSYLASLATSKKGPELFRRPEPRQHSMGNDLLRVVELFTNGPYEPNPRFTHLLDPLPTLTDKELSSFASQGGSPLQ